MTTLSDETLQSLLDTAAGSFPVPAEGSRQVRASARPARARIPVRRLVQLAAAAAVLALAVLVVPHLGASSNTTSSSSSAGGTSSSAAGTASGAVAAPAPLAAGGSAGGASKVAGGPVRGSAPIADGAATRVVKTGTIALVAGDGKVTAVLTAVQTVVQGLSGYVSASTTQEFGSTPTGTVTFRIPAANYERAVAQIRAVHATVRSATTSGQDVTASYTDLQAQIASLQAARSRFLTILAQARTIGETLTVQQRVDDVQGQIDQLEGRRRLLADQSDLATLTVTVTQQDDPVLRHVSSRSGLGRAFSDAGHGFSSGIEALIARSGRFVVVLLVIALLAVVGRVGWKLVRRQLV